MTTPNDSDAERELQRVEEIERNKMQDRTKAIVEAAEALEAELHERAEQHVFGRNAELRDVENMIEFDSGGLDGSIVRECVRQLVRAVSMPVAEPVVQSPTTSAQHLHRLVQDVALAASSNEMTRVDITIALCRLVSALTGEQVPPKDGV